MHAAHFVRRVLLSGIALTMLTATAGRADIPFTKHVIATDFDGPNSVHAADVDGDGDVDVLGTAFYDDDLTIWYNQGGYPPTWIPQTVAWGFNGAHYVNTVDIDDDGDPDLLGAAQLAGKLAWWRNDGGDPVAWSKSFIDTAYAGAQQVYPDDVDGDGDPDVFACAYIADDVSWYRNDGGDPIVWTKHIIGGPAGAPVSIEIRDLDLDGDTDVLSAAYGDGSISWWRNDGGSPPDWSEQIISATYNGAHEVFTADLDNDGDIDIQGSAYALNDITWWRNDGGEPVVWTEETIAPAFVGAASVHAADMNGDGRIDVLGAAQAAGDVGLWLNGGGEPVQWTEQMIDVQLPGAWGHKAWDLDLDGDMDLLAGGMSADQIVWYENTGGLAAPLTETVAGDRIGASPNPFDAQTTVSFNLERSGRVRLTVHDVSGRRVAVLANRNWAEGAHTVVWEGVGLSGRRLSSGAYFLRLDRGGRVTAKRLVLVN